ncbi:MAG TPA: discoidin domain-containing protein [Thermoguttaceae bacterium]|nr:discoidin domain-containing protein [Thermoguttaceae bacterium]
MKNRVLMLLIVGLALAAMGIAATAQAATTLADVAAFKPTEGTEAFSPPPPAPPAYPKGNGNDESRQGSSFTHGDETNDSYWRVDLGMEYTVDHVEIQCRHDNYGIYASRTNGATLQGYASDGITPVGPAIVLSGFSADAGNIVDRLSWDNSGAGWAGVQYFQLGGTDLAPAYMHIAEFQAMGVVETYPNFITGITATATNVYSPDPTVGPMNLVNNRGMDDQGVGVGNPAALHRDVFGDGLWHTTYNPTEDPVVTFDLGQKYDLTGMVIWNEHQSGDRCVKDCTIEYSVNGTDYTALLDANGGELGNYTLTPYDNVNFSPPWAASDTIDLGTENVEAQYLRMTIHSGWGDIPGGDRNYVGLSEVRFYGESMVGPQIPGDTGTDGIVDATDAEVVAAHWGASTTNGASDGDFNTDGVVNALDASILAANWGDHNVESAVGVPEPSALVLLGALLGLGLFRRRAR